MIKTYVNNIENDELFELSHFPGGEPHVKINTHAAHIGDKIDIILKGSDLHEYAQVFMMVNLLKQHKVKPGVFVPYLAGARADKDATKGWKPYAMFAEKFPRLTVADIHSLENMDFFSPFDNIRPDAIIPKDILHQYDVVVAPDAGATTRAREVAGVQRHLVTMNKERDQDTGRIIRYEFNDYISVPSFVGRKVLVVDDICDGGMTFKLLAEAFEHRGQDKLDLYVTHGIFSGNAKENLSEYDTIYTTNSLESANNVDAHIFDIERIYLEDSSAISN